jgi:hypothetical protein
MLESRQRGTKCDNFALVEHGCRNEDPRVAEAQPLMNRFWAEGREQRTEHIAVFQGSERADVKLRNSSRQQEHAFTSGEAKALQNVGEPIGKRP